MLYIVSTPIGNLKDITLRAIDTLRMVDLVAAEDTRHTGILCREYGITAPLTSCFEHNEQGKAAQFLALLKEGKNIALVSDAGTPGISDPGFRLIRLAKENGIEMTVVPGACAAIAALTLSGLPSDEFVFKGFLPVKPGQRRKALEQVRGAEGTVIFYESPHRLLKSLQDAVEVLEDPLMVVTRELTKKFEERREGRASELLAYFSSHKILGEFVLLFPPQ
ncbi:MAG: 16S rRNA (cytidine(1402)-2'-O)-methyltransferase, partial [Candidatus Omnitrophica bacterium]|nr:16S rRNA (cytidine(1402)-2'-O)-methyltransferase [Candidatus Omnitrophota bacterium]